MLKRQVAPAIGPDGFVPGSALDRQSTPDLAARFAPKSYDSEARTVDAVFSSGSRVRRWGIFEELAIAPDAIDLSRVAQGQVRLLNSHNQYDINDILGTIEDARIEGAQLVGRIRFAETDAGRAAEAMVTSGDVRGLSVGYRVTAWRLSQVENDVEVWRAEKWELLEVSLVAVPADPSAMTRSGGSAGLTATQTEADDMRRNVQAGDAPVPVNTPAPGQSAPVSAAPAADAIRAERERCAAINDIGTRAGLPASDIAAAVSDGTAVEAFRTRAFNELVSRQPAATHAVVQRDETETRRVAMEEAVIRSMNPDAMPGEWSQAAAQFRGMNLVSLAEVRLNERRTGDSLAAREDILRRAMHSTSDFPIILENAMNRTVAARYALAQPTYRQFAVRQDFNDFRPHISVTAGDFPMLEKIGEGGAIKFGTIGEKKEQVSVASYAKGVSISRQVLVNDTLGALDDVLAGYGQTVALMEEVTAYGVLGANSGDGPALLEGAANMFTTGRTNKAGTATAINEAGVSAGRAAMRKFTSVDGNVLLYNAPALILCSPDKETEAEKFVSTVVAAQTANVNPFAGKLRVVVGAMLSGNRWWLFCEPSIRSNFRWGLLSGYTAPRVRVDEPFGSQGMGMTVEHDFGFGGIDWRAGYVNAGA